MSNTHGKTIADLQAEFEGCVKPITPPGVAARASIRKADTHRQIRRDADASHFDLALCEVVLSFEPAVKSKEGGGAHDGAAHSTAQENHPEAKRILAESPAERSPFRPILLPGGELSASILAERR